MDTVIRITIDMATNEFYQETLYVDFRDTCRLIGGKGEAERTLRRPEEKYLSTRIIPAFKTPPNGEGDGRDCGKGGKPKMGFLRGRKGLWEGNAGRTVMGGGWKGDNGIIDCKYRKKIGGKSGDELLGRTRKYDAYEGWGGREGLKAILSAWR